MEKTGKEIYIELKELLTSNSIFKDYYKERALVLTSPLFSLSNRNFTNSLVVPLITKLKLTEECEVVGYLDLGSDDYSNWIFLDPNKKTHNSIDPYDSFWWGIINITIESLEEEWKLVIDAVNSLGKERNI